MKKLTLLITLFCVGLTLTSSAQIVDRSKDRAKNKANNRVDNKIDKGIDSGLDAIEGLFKKKDKNKDKGDKSQDAQTETQEQNEEMPGFTMGGKADVEDSYTFDHSIDLKMITTDKKGKQETMDMTMMVAEESGVFGTEMIVDGAKSFSIMDLANGKVITLTNAEGMKIGMVVQLDPESMQQGVDGEGEMPDFKKTGRTKVILGYTCEEYTYETEEETMSMWMTDETSFSLTDAFSTMAAQNPDFQNIYAEKTWLEMTMTNKKNPKETMVMQVTQINENQPTTVKTEGYSFFGG
ncbi:MAG: DUF4412 domain-containing protein [Flavobacteriales bacterium]|nr:DUF4412 domain-containing protein [Flavobacteriales bacterium]